MARSVQTRLPPASDCSTSWRILRRSQAKDIISPPHLGVSSSAINLIKANDWKLTGDLVRCPNHLIWHLLTWSSSGSILIVELLSLSERSVCAKPQMMTCCGCTMKAESQVQWQSGSFWLKARFNFLFCPLSVQQKIRDTHSLHFVVL